MKMMMAWRLTLVMVVVCVGNVCSSGQADLMSKLLMPRDYGVKLCGREFIRAVIFTCGGSRWRRSTDQEFEGHHGDVVEENSQYSSPLVSELTDNHTPFQTPQSSLADLLVIYGALGERQPQHQQQVFSEPKFPEQPQLSILSGEQVAISFADNWSMSNRKKRNFSLGVAGMCCSQGCTKNDIVRLC